MNKRPSIIYTKQIGSKIEFELEVQNEIEILQELNDINAMSEVITVMIQQRTTRVTKATEKPLKWSISSAMVGNGDDTQQTVKAEIC